MTITLTSEQASEIAAVLKMSQAALLKSQKPHMSLVHDIASTFAMLKQPQEQALMKGKS